MCEKHAMKLTVSATIGSLTLHREVSVTIQNDTVINKVAETSGLLRRLLMLYVVYAYSLLKLLNS